VAVRFLGVDLGRRRIGLALSDASGTLARPWIRVPAGTTPDASAAAIASAIDRAADPLDDQAAIGAIVLGLPRRLGGDDNDMTAHVRQVAHRLREQTGLAVHLQDERLTSAEAESRLAQREKDWRRRKDDIDAVAASIILQDFLDSRPQLPPG
jgi:putative Holliday junction resolvase